MPERRDNTTLWVLGLGGVAGLVALMWPREAAAKPTVRRERTPGLQIGSKARPEAPAGPDLVIDLPEDERAPPGKGPGLQIGSAKPQPPPPEDEPEDPGPPDVDAWIRTDPTVSALFQVSRGWTFSGTGRKSIVYQALLRYGKELASTAGRPEAWAVSAARSASNRVDYLDLIQCGGWNALLYATFGYGKGSHESPNFKAIRLVPQHADNAARMRRGEPPLRVIQMRTMADRGKGNAYAADRMHKEGFELLWLPALNPTAYLDGVVTCEGMTWPDGSSKMWPPPAIMALDFAVIDDPGFAVYGCRVAGADGRVAV